MTHVAALRENAARIGLPLFSPRLMLSLFAMLFLFAGFVQATVSVRIESTDDPVHAYVTVTDNNGNPVTGLQAGAFVTTLNGSSNATATTFAPASGSLSVVFVMDSSGSLFGSNRAAMIDGVKSFIESMDANDRASIVKFNGALGAQVIQPTRPFTAIENGPGSIGPGEQSLLDAASAAYPDNGFGTNIFDALMLALQQFTDAGGTLPSGPRAIILLSDGQDNASTNDMNDVLVAANSARVPIFTINVGDFNNVNAPTSGAALLNQLAAQTGATYRFAENATDIEPAYAAIETRLNNEYLLTFPFDPNDCGPQDIVIAVTGQAIPFTGTFESCLQLFAPDLIGMTRGAALIEIAERGLNDDSINEQFHPTVPVDIVFGQNPLAHVPVDAGDEIDITVSVGPLPNVVGETQSAATTTLTSAGLAVGAIATQNSALVAGVVISQNPTSAAAGVPKGAPVSLVVSLGPTIVTVPNVVGKTETAARSDLSAVGLINVAVTQQASATVAAGSVISQNPAGGTAGVLQNVTVNLVISSGVPTVAVPNVVGQTQADATTALTNAQLVLGTVTQQSSDTVASGRVISQTPVAGTTVQQGTSVSIVVSTGAPASSGGGSGGGGGGAAGLLEILACLGLALFRRWGVQRPSA
jgi:VWFA-related protein